MFRVSTVAVTIAAFGIAPAFANDTARHPTSALANWPQQMAQMRDRDGRDRETIREEENRRSGGTGVAPAPLRPQRDGKTMAPQSGTTGAGQNQGSPPGTSSGNGSSGAPSTNSPNQATNPNAGSGTTNNSPSGSGSGGTGGSGTGGTGTGGAGGSGGGSGG